MTDRHDFASDNSAGVAPEAWTALEKANRGYTPGYGADHWTQHACDLIRELFETDCEVFFTFNGTAANSLALASMCQSYHGIICHQYSHVETDECGAPEFFSNGTKVLLVEGEHGKVDLAAVGRRVTKRSDLHYPKPKVLSITQPTELGTLYDTDDLDAINELKTRLALRLHMDGARFFNAAAALDIHPAEITWRRGVDVLCLGGTKLGMPVGDAVVFFDRALAGEFEYRCKQAGQLASKMRYLAAPWVGMLEGHAWLRHARHGNACAQRLAEELVRVPGVSLLVPVQANAVFAQLPDRAASGLKTRGWHFYDFIGDGGARFMCSWQTTDEQIDDLVAAIRDAVG
ncbi:MAG: low specificity L-threonine aldolase [Gammaproteobacteria bacterium]|nr:low specificity L-threonine aldolase [Gammaproteobacteria bacterium]